MAFGLPRVGDIVEDTSGKFVEVNGASQNFCANLLEETASVPGRERLPRLGREQRKLHATRAAALRLRTVDDDVNVIYVIEVRCVAQAIVNWQREMFGVTEDARMPERVLEAGRGASNADRVSVCCANENFGEFWVGLAKKLT